MITFFINNKKVQCEKGITILTAARNLGIKIPTLCYQNRLTPPGLCRLCVVEVEGARVLLPSCITTVTEVMKIQTESFRVIRARKTILEMLNASSDLSSAPDLLEQIEHYSADSHRFKDTKSRNFSVLDDNPFYIRDYSKCILCEKCVQVCSEDIQFSFALTTSGRGYENRINTFYNKKLPETSCVFCGNCIEVCPTGALQTRSEYLEERGNNDYIR
jgi:NADP-reducing hydrogenase subunit HndD